jgi:hypothetical protein
MSTLLIPMVGEKQQLVNLQMNRLEFKTAGELLIVLEEFIEYTPI